MARAEGGGGDHGEHFPREEGRKVAEPDANARRELVEVPTSRVGKNAEHGEKVSKRDSPPFPFL